MAAGQKLLQLQWQAPSRHVLTCDEVAKGPCGWVHWGDALEVQALDPLDLLRVADIKDDIAFNAYITNASITVGTGELTSVALQFTVDGPFIELVDA